MFLANRLLAKQVFLFTRLVLKEKRREKKECLSMGRNF